jgi:hypothetical protein
MYICIYVFMYVYMYIQGSPVEIPNPTQCNLICLSMITLSPVLSPSSIFPLNSGHCSLFSTKEHLEHMYKMSFQEIACREIASVGECLYTWLSGLCQPSVIPNRKKWWNRYFFHHLGYIEIYSKSVTQWAMQAVTSPPERSYKYWFRNFVFFSEYEIMDRAQNWNIANIREATVQI